MANLAQFVGEKAQESQRRALLEDLTESYIGFRPGSRLALAIWFAKSLSSQEQYLLYIFTGPPVNGIADMQVSLHWKVGAQGPPFVHIDWTDVAWFSTLLKADPGRVARYQKDYEVLYFDSSLLTPQILDTFQIITEPPGLMKGWHITEDEYVKARNTQDLLSQHAHARPHFGMVKIEEKDFEQCRGILHVETSHKWLPLSAEGIQPYTYYHDQQKGWPVYFLFEGGALYQVLRFEVKTAPDYADRFRLLGKTPNDRYPEVYLRAVHPPAQPAA